MALIAARAPRTTERREAGCGNAGLFGLAERQADIEDTEATHEAGGFRRKQRAFQAANRDREVRAERRTSGVVAESARKVDRDAESAERLGRTEEGAEFGREGRVEALAEDTVEDEAELVSREEAEVRGGNHADADARLAGGPGALGLGAGWTAFGEDGDNLRAASGAMQRSEEGVGAVITFAGEDQNPFRLTAE